MPYGILKTIRSHSLSAVPTRRRTLIYKVVDTETGEEVSDHFTLRHAKAYIAERMTREAANGLKK